MPAIFSFKNRKRKKNPAYHHIETIEGFKTVLKDIRTLKRSLKSLRKYILKSIQKHYLLQKNITKYLTLEVSEENFKKRNKVLGNPLGITHSEKVVRDTEVTEISWRLLKRHYFRF